MHYDPGFFDHLSGRAECAPNPSGVIGVEGVYAAISAHAARRLGSCLSSEPT
jgi:hypothetical protein